MKNLYIASIVLVGLPLTIWHGQKVDIEKEKAELLRLHQQARQAHFNRDAALLVSTFGAEMISVRDGQVKRQDRDESRQRFEQYFRGAEFSEWDDLMPPIIHVSPDGKMAWMIVRVKGKYTRTDSTGAKSQEEFTSAWMSTYEKQGTKWIHVANASTFEAR